jgi:3-deoxy-D-manno-octulosonic acid (KDO) 8-phosphate synthase
VLLAAMNALVAMAGIAAPVVARGSSSNCPGTGAEGSGGETFTWEASAQPGVKVNVAACLVNCVDPSVGCATASGCRSVGTSEVAC